MATARGFSEAEREAWVKFAAVLELLPAQLDTQLSRDEQLTHFDYFALAILSQAPDRTLRMSALAGQTNATLPRLSRVVSRLETAGFVERSRCADDGRAINVTLTPAGRRKVVQAGPGHVATVRELVLDNLSAAQVEQLSEIASQLLSRLDPGDQVFATMA